MKMTSSLQVVINRHLITDSTAPSNVKEDK
jgi:hypothetical protein